MTEQEAKALAAELEGNRYWEVVQIGPVGHNPFDDEETCVFVARHLVARWLNIRVFGAFSAKGIRDSLIEDGPKYARPEYRERPTP